MYIATIADNVIRKVDSLGLITTIAGTGVAGFNGDGHPALETQFDYLNRITYFGDNIYVADYHNHRVRIIKYNTTTVPGYLVESTRFYPNPTTNTLSLQSSGSISNITVTTMLGEKVLVTELPDQPKTYRLTLGNIPSGIYLLYVNGVYAGNVMKM